MSRYRTWKPNHTFFCGGRVMLGPDNSALTATAVFIGLTWVVLVVWILPLSPIVRDKGLDEDEYDIFDEPLPFVYNYGIPLLGLLMNELSLFATAMVEPGIVPPRKSSVKTLVLSHELRLHNKHLYCSICNIVRPDMRCRHCRHCNCCVQVLDHHCPWIGTCIGVRNYRFFFVFVASVVLSILFLIGNVAWVVNEWATGNLSTERDVSLSAHQRAVYSFLIASSTVLYLGFLLFSASLLVFHCYLIRNCSTTAEFLRRNYDQHHSTAATSTAVASASASASAAASSNAGTTSAATATAASSNSTSNSNSNTVTTTGAVAGTSEGVGATLATSTAAATAVVDALDELEQGKRTTRRAEGPAKGENGGRQREKLGDDEDDEGEDEDEDEEVPTRDRSGSVSSVRSAASAASMHSRRGDLPIEALHAARSSSSMAAMRAASAVSEGGGGASADRGGAFTPSVDATGSGGSKYMPLPLAAAEEREEGEGQEQEHSNAPEYAAREGHDIVPLVPPAPMDPSPSPRTTMACNLRVMMGSARDAGAVLMLYLFPPASQLPPLHLPPTQYDRELEQRQTEETARLLKQLLRGYREQRTRGLEIPPFRGVPAAAEAAAAAERDKQGSIDSDGGGGASSGRGSSSTRASPQRDGQGSSPFETPPSGGGGRRTSRGRGDRGMEVLI